MKCRRNPWSRQPVHATDVVRQEIQAAKPWLQDILTGSPSYTRQWSLAPICTLLKSSTLVHGCRARLRWYLEYRCQLIQILRFSRASDPCCPFSCSQAHWFLDASSPTLDQNRQHRRCRPVSASECGFTAFPTVNRGAMSSTRHRCAVRCQRSTELPPVEDSARGSSFLDRTATS